MNIQLKNQMSRRLVTVTADTTVEKAYQLMINEWIRHLPVVSEDGTTVLGMVSDRDLLGASSRHGPVKNIMSPNVKYFDISTPIKKIVHSMIDNKISSFLITENDSVMGIVTSEDMLILLSQMLNTEETDELIVKKWMTNPVMQNAVHMLSQAGI